ncbi:MAG TPA: pyridoxal 5'-phosphate synthase glutaminase subunit PdxT [Candidatus Methanoperedenaceae archaeon]|nr:pyridoxal 5'-phosphate synthase glutaminase subunit PdxT [Candidatus Methanoperedenaceae archaeon]
MRIGVIAIQGDVEEHIASFRKALGERRERGQVIRIDRKGVIPSCDAVVIPGGESTTIGRLLEREGIADEIRGSRDVPIFATCAGLVLLAKHGDEQVMRTGQPLLGLMDITVNRNAFGRQRESFEAELSLSFLDRPYNAVFIRAPAITEAGSRVEVLGTYDNLIVAARQGKMLALAFHPELTDDTRIHHYFLDII